LQRPIATHRQKLLPDGARDANNGNARAVGRLGGANGHDARAADGGSGGGARAAGGAALRKHGVMRGWSGMWWEEGSAAVFARAGV
jgi:hypothetical protein